MNERVAGRFALLQRLGRGGMGTVFLARDETTGAECALKRLDPAVTARVDEAARREFEALTRVRHPAIVAVHEFGVAPEGGAYLVMEYVPGVAADRALPRRDWRALVAFAAQVAAGLEALHAAGVAHGDLKPSNVLVLPGLDGARAGGVRLVDFGLAALIGRGADGHCGTPGFAAPEVVRGQAPDAAADLYGLGATLYALVAGHRPFESRDVSSQLRAQQAGPPAAAALEEGGLPAWLVQLVLTLMAPDPRERPASARDVRQTLERLHPGARRPLAQRLQAVRVVGRERELMRIEGWLATAPRRATVLWVTGTPGTGVSALLDEVAVRATLAARLPIRLAPRPDAAPGALARVLLRRLASEAGAERAGSEVDAVGTWLAAEDGGVPAPDLDALTARALVWAGQLDGAGRTPLVLLDDARRVDDLSAALLRRLALHIDARALPMLWAGPGAPALVEGLVGGGAAERVVLPPLAPEALARLADARLGAPCPAPLHAFLLRRSGGHPGLAVALLTLAAERGAVRETEHGLVVSEAELEQVVTPASFDDALLAPVRALPEPARRIATGLAAWGRPVSRAELEVVAAVADEALATLLAAGIAEREPDGRLTLAAGRTGEVLLAALAPAERVALHRAVLDRGRCGARERFLHLREADDLAGALAAAAEAFEVEPDADLAVAAAELAERTADPTAGTWLERAGVALSARGRFADAAPRLERALELGRDARVIGRIAALLATAQLRAGRHRDIARVVERGLAADPEPRDRVRLLTVEASRRVSDGELGGAEQVARAALEAAEQAQDDESMGGAALTLAGIRIAQGDLDDARGLASRAEQWCARAGQVQNQARSRGLRARLAWESGLPEEAERLYRSALDLARAGGARLAEEELDVFLAHLLTQLGRWTEAYGLRAAGARIALEDGRMRGAVGALVGLALDEALFGHPREAWRRATCVRPLARRHLPYAEAGALRVQAWALRMAGRLRRAESRARRALASAARGAFPGEIDWCHVELARALAARGRWTACGEVCATALVGPLTDVSARAVLAALAGRSALRSRAVGEARARLAEAEHVLERRTQPYAAAHVGQLRAELRLSDGRRADGIAIAQQCLAAFDSLPAPAERAEAAAEFARLALADAAPPEPMVARWLEDAASTLERLGDHRARERALALRVECHHREAPPTPATAHDRNLIEAVSGLLGSLSDPHEVARRALALAVEQLEAERGVLLLRDTADGPLEPIAEHGAVDAGTRREAITFSRRIVARVVESGGSLLVTDAPSDPRARSDSVVDLHLRSILCVPLYLGGRVIGAVYLDDSRRSDAFDDRHRSLLEGVAQLVAIALEKSRGHDEVQRANEQLVGENLALRRSVAERYQSHAVIGLSSPMQRVLATVERAAATSATVLVTGENGTGKELVARVLHASGKRRHGPFVTVNCGAIPEPLLEAELFGILPNVATGVRGRDGRFVQADGGTLFLDEIGEMPPGQQVALLSALSSREVTPVGGSRPIPVDVRVIAATNQDLRRRIAEGQFRDDLFYRLSVIPIEVPPLREHKGDIRALARHFVQHFAQQHERDVPELSPEFMAVLMQCDWPGNVRELQNYIERVLAMTPGPVLHPDPLPRELEGREHLRHVSRHRRLGDQLEELESRLVREALERAEGNISRAARALGISETAMRVRISKYGLDRSAARRAPRRH